MDGAFGVPAGFEEGTPRPWTVSSMAAVPLLGSTAP